MTNTKVLGPKDELDPDAVLQDLEEYMIIAGRLSEGIRNNPEEVVKNATGMSEELAKAILSDPEFYANDLQSIHDSLKYSMQNPEKLLADCFDMDRILTEEMEKDPELINKGYHKMDERLARRRSLDRMGISNESDIPFGLTIPPERLMAAYKVEKNPDVRARMLAVNIVCMYNERISFAAEMMMKSPAWVSKWVKIFKEGGIDAIRKV